MAAHAFIGCASAADERASGRSEDLAFLDGLVGDFTMSGSVTGDLVRYEAHGERVLTGAWIEFHMIDASRPPNYEARVFIGFDNEAGDYVAHWLDGFGAAGARVTATGKRDGDTLVLNFPYAEGAFRNRWERRGDNWVLKIESEGADGDWSEFASYLIERR